MSAPLGLYTKLVLMTALWGGQFIAGRTLAPLLPDFTAGTMRFLAATVVLVALARLRAERGDASGVTGARIDELAYRIVALDASRSVP